MGLANVLCQWRLPMGLANGACQRGLPMGLASSACQLCGVFQAVCNACAKTHRQTDKDTDTKGLINRAVYLLTKGPK